MLLFPGGTLNSPNLSSPCLLLLLFPTPRPESSEHPQPLPKKEEKGTRFVGLLLLLLLLPLLQGVEGEALLSPREGRPRQRPRDCAQALLSACTAAAAARDAFPAPLRAPNHP
jgi:hypothetical protein